MRSCPASPRREEHTIRVATYNTSLFRDTDGELVRDLEAGDNEQARKIAEVIQRVRPDVLLVNEFDYDASGRAAELFSRSTWPSARTAASRSTIRNHFTGPGEHRPAQRHCDLNNNGRSDDPDDAFGFGQHEGQYGMLVLSRFPIDRAVRPHVPKVPLARHAGRPAADRSRRPASRITTTQRSGHPAALVEELLGRADRRFRRAAAAARPGNFTYLCSHPTPPVFDGPEDRNGRRNHDEIRLAGRLHQPRTERLPGRRLRRPRRPGGRTASS